MGGLLPQASASSAPASPSDYDPNLPSFPLGPFAEADMVFPEVQIQNVAVLAVVFLVGLLVNLMALPVILFRRTKFGNGLFAVLILCLTVSDLAVIFFSVLGGLIVEASNLLWGGTVGSCKVRTDLFRPLLLYATFLFSRSITGSRPGSRGCRRTSWWRSWAWS